VYCVRLLRVACCASCGFRVWGLSFSPPLTHPPTPLPCAQTHTESHKLHMKGLSNRSLHCVRVLCAEPHEMSVLSRARSPPLSFCVSLSLARSLAPSLAHLPSPSCVHPSLSFPLSLTHEVCAKVPCVLDSTACVCACISLYVCLYLSLRVYVCLCMCVSVVSVS